jgi:hypothetical protein
MDSDRDTARAVGCPIRRSRDQRALASPPGLSQRATSFIASQCQGIHQMPLSCFIRRAPRRNPRPALPVAPRGKPRNPTRFSPAIASRQRPGHCRTGNGRVKTRFTAIETEAALRSPPPSQGGRTRSAKTLSFRLGRFALSSRCQRTRRGRQTRAPANPCFFPIVASPQAPRHQRFRHACGTAVAGPNCVRSVVEVNGIEPMTSCLQSRRSPN